MICSEIDWRCPSAAFAPLAGEAHAHLLSAGDVARGGWSVLVAFPAQIIAAEPNDGGAWLATVQEVIDARAVDMRAAPTQAPFHSGLVGYVGYEALKKVEPNLDLPASPYALPDAVFGVYDAAAVFSREDQRAFVVGRDEAACDQLANALGSEPVAAPALPEFSAPTSNFTRQEYEAAVASIIEKIKCGDFYQANIAQTLQAAGDNGFSPFDLYRAIARESDAEFGAILQYRHGAVLSNSPERFFKVEPRKDGRCIVVEPIKGTRGRSADRAEDAALAEALVNDPKDRAENIMIADLMRNDLSKICVDGSIEEEAICALMTLTKVHHLVSRISGVLRADASMSDVFRALFPSGSITGAPKIEAMGAIAEVEKAGRGPYCGAIGFFDDAGGADFSVAIRTLITNEAATTVFAPVGGGVTLRSNPQAEYEETLIKAKSALDVLAPRARP
jgi:para-aminobenzoate synthetase component I